MFLNIIIKQLRVDPEWLTKKKFGGPTETDLRAIEVPDPLVSVKLHYNNNNNKQSGTSQSRYKYNSSIGLHSQTDPTTLLPEFRIELNSDQFLGKPHEPIIDSSSYRNRLYEDHRVTNMLGLLSLAV